MADAILVLNAGSSSLKFSVFLDGKPPVPLLRGQLEGLATQPRFLARDQAGSIVGEREWASGTRLGHEGAIEFLFTWGRGGALRGHRIVAAGHRVVHGGLKFTQPVRVDPNVLTALEAFVPLAPLHQPHNLAAIRAIAQHAPDLSQVACFDTSFHRTQPQVAQAFALPRRYTEEGVCRYGFHGLSYEYIASVLPGLDARAAAGRTVVAHLGNGASMCALRGGHSLASTMGFTALDGLPMGTRCGALDPGVLLYLMDQHGLDARALEKVIYQDSGLLGVSGISSDVRTLLASPDPRAAEALDLFVYRIGRELGSLAAALGGLDALVFTGGIGENAATLRARVCRDATWLGVDLDEAANEARGPRISRPESRVAAWVVPTNEELMIAQHTRRLLADRRR
ncbi:MAG TPA: acetate/propionate family kinase [Gemmataceae bacterium]|nr:acetate/propionate family kinase [Gemmataceae bacterium]